MDETRVVRTRVATTEGKSIFASGYIVAPGRVLTARHVLAPKGGTPVKGLPCEIQLWPCTAQEPWLPASVAWISTTLDAALVQLRDEDRRPTDVVWGNLSGTEPLSWNATGFPLAALDEEGRKPEQPYGRFSPLSSAPDGLALTIESRQPIEKSLVESQWAGLSGAAVFSGRLLIGIITTDPSAWATSLVGLRVSTISQDPGLVAAMGQQRIALRAIGSLDSDLLTERAYRDLATQMGVPVDLGPAAVEEHIVDVLVRNRTTDQDSRGKEDLLSAFTGKPRARLLVVGGGGSGKTTMLLRYNWLAAEASHRAGMPTPLFASLNLVEAGGGATFESLFSILGERAEITAAELQSAWRDGEEQLVFLLDGLNEVRRDDQDALLSALARLMAERRHRYVITTRPTDIVPRLRVQIPDTTELHVVQLRPSDVQAYILSYGLETLFSTMGDQLQGLAKNPFMLWAIVQACQGLAAERLPANVGELYQLFLDDYVFSRREPFKRPPRVDYDYPRVKRPVLAMLALKMSISGSTRLALDDDVTDEVASLLESVESAARRRWHVMPPDPTATELLEEMEYNGVLRRAGDSMIFMHESVQEYYSALALRDEDSETAAHRAPQLDWRLVGTGSRGRKLGYQDNSWSNVTVMLAGLLENSTPLVLALADWNPLLAARCLAASHTVLADVRGALIEKWASLLSRKDERYRLIACECLEAARVSSVNVAERLLEVYEDDPSRNVQYAAGRALETCESSCFPALLDAAVASEYQWESLATEILTPGLDDQSARTMLQKWRAASPPQRRRLEDVYALIGVEPVRTLMREIVADNRPSEDEVERESARQVLADIDEWRRRAALAYNLTDPLMPLPVDWLETAREQSERERLAAKAKLRAAPLEDVIVALTVPRSNVRQAAAAVLSDREGPEAARLLLDQVWHESDPYMAKLMIGALAKRPDSQSLVQEIIDEVVAVRHDGLPAPHAALLDATLLHGAQHGRTQLKLDPDEVACLVSALRAIGFILHEDDFDEAQTLGGDHHLLLLGVAENRFAFVKVEGRLELVDLRRRARAIDTLAGIGWRPAIALFRNVAAQASVDAFLGRVDGYLAAEELGALRASAVESLADLDASGQAPFLLQQLRRELPNGSWSIVKRLMNAVVSARHRPAIPVLLDSLTFIRRDGEGEEGWGVRWIGRGIAHDIHDFIRSLAPPSDVIPELERMLRDTTVMTRIAAVRELARWEASPDALVECALFDHDSSVRQEAAGALRGYPGRDVVTSIEEGLRSSTVGERLAAAQALSVLRDPESGTALLAALEDLDGAVAVAAAMALLSLQEDSFVAPASSLLLELVRSQKGEFDAIRVGAALLEAGPEVADQLPGELLMDIARSSDISPGSRDKAFEAIGGFESGPGGRALATFDAGHFVEAIGDLSALISTGSGRRPYFEQVALWYRGLSYAAQSDFERGDEDLSAAGLAQWDEARRMEYAKVLLGAGRRAQIRRLVSKYSRDPDGFAANGYVQYLAGDYDAALESLKRAAAGGDPEVVVRALLTEVLVLLCRHRVMLAEDIARDAMRASTELEGEAWVELLGLVRSELSDGMRRGWISAHARSRVLAVLGSRSVIEPS